MANKRPEAVREEIVRALRLVTEGHAAKHPTGHYSVELVRRRLELQSDTTAFSDVEAIVEKHLPEELVRIARQMHAGEHKGESFHIEVERTEEAPRQQGTADRSYVKDEQEKEILLGCTCGWTATMSDVLAGQARPSYAQKTKEKRPYGASQDKYV